MLLYAIRKYIVFCRGGENILNFFVRDGGTSKRCAPKPGDKYQPRWLNFSVFNFSRTKNLISFLRQKGYVEGVGFQKSRPFASVATVAKDPRDGGGSRGLLVCIYISKKVDLGALD